MSESIWLSSGSKVEILFKFILMHLNSIVPVGISVIGFFALICGLYDCFSISKLLRH